VAVAVALALAVTTGTLADLAVTIFAVVVDVLALKPVVDVLMLFMLLRRCFR
jgi:hypothetical protein